MNNKIKKNDKKEAAEDHPNEKQIRREYAYSAFKKSFTLDEKIDATNIDAIYVNGVLSLNLPKKETVIASAQRIIIN